MNKLERNLIDNILESEIKLGCADTSISFYYPITLLTELLECDADGLDLAIAEFRQHAQNHLGRIVFEELSGEKGRYAVTIPACGTSWVHDNYQPSEFMKEFIREINRPENTLDEIVKLFRKYSHEVDIKKVSDEEWAIAFLDESVDPYVYHIEQNVFGLEYHRFTKKSYEKMMANGNR